MKESIQFAIIVAMIPVGTLFFSGCERVETLLNRGRLEEERKAQEAELAAAKAAAEAAMEPVVIEIPDPEEVEEFVVDQRNSVSVLGYHDFSERYSSSNAMIIQASKFEEQMQAIADLGIEVVSMSDFLAWKRGEKNIPDPSIVITIDDGWEGTHTYALPILEKFGFPFPVFIYTNYLNIGGRSLSLEQVNDLIAAGGEIGSHGISHKDMTNRHGMSEEDYEDWLRQELKESAEILRGHFGEGVISVFSYPFGTYSERIMELAREAGYEACVTVDGKKSYWHTDNMEVGRYIVHGNNDRNIDLAVQFRSSGSNAAGSKLLGGRTDAGGETVPPLVSVWPGVEEAISERQPRVRVDLSRLEGVDPASIEMTVSGLGKVPVSYHAGRGEVSYRIPYRLRDRECRVWLRFRRMGEREDDVISWAFFVDRQPFYLEGEGETEGEEGGLGEPVALGGEKEN
ncbi:MAG: polysaccharide deacetylase family protein [Verrucomicrobiota bacterium]